VRVLRPGLSAGLRAQRRPARSLGAMWRGWECARAQCVRELCSRRTLTRAQATAGRARRLVGTVPRRFPGGSV